MKREKKLNKHQCTVIAEPFTVITSECDLLPTWYPRIEQSEITGHQSSLILLNFGTSFIINSRSIIYLLPFRSWL